MNTASIKSEILLSKGGMVHLNEIIKVNGEQYKVTSIQHVEVLKSGKVQVIYRAHPVKPDDIVITDKDRTRALEYDVSPQLLYYRLKRSKYKWTKEEAITTPPKNIPQALKNYDPDIMEAKANGINENTYRSRLALGWTVKQAKTIPVNSHRILTEEEDKVRKANGIRRNLVRDRLLEGWDIEDAITVTPKVGGNRGYSRKVKK